METTKKAIQITTGKYGAGTPQENATVDLIFGREWAEERFELYFHWYNLLHELGHGIQYFYGKECLHPAEEEQLVNDFAVAFWCHYSAQERIHELCAVVSYALAQMEPTVGEGVSHMKYAMEKWGQEELYTFHNYGWFQFSCVEQSLKDGAALGEVLRRMGVSAVTEQPRKNFDCGLPGEDSASRTVAGAVSLLREWGVELPEVSVVLVDDPNRHMCRIVE